MNQVLFRLAALDYQKTLIIGLILGVAYYFSIYDDGSSIQSQMDTVNQQIAVEQQRQQESEKSIKKAEKLKSEVAALNDLYKDVSSQIPKEVLMADVIRVIDSMATTSGVSIKAKEPKKPENRKILEEVPIRVTAEGSFSELTMFLFNIMKEQKFSRISSFTITRQTGREAKTKPLTMEALIANYRYVGEKDSKESADEAGVKK